MIPNFLLDQTAIVTHYELTEDPKGAPVRSVAWTASYPCRLDFRTTIEETTGRNRTTSQKIVFLPPDAVIYAEDDVVIDGTVYHVQGEPDRLRAFGSVHHVEAELRSVDDEARNVEAPA